MRVASEGTVAAVHDLAELISICAQLRGERVEGDGVVWAATAALLGRGELDEARAALRERGDLEPLAAAARSAASTAAVDRALALHAARVR